MQVPHPANFIFDKHKLPAMQWEALEGEIWRWSADLAEVAALNTGFSPHNLPSSEDGFRAEFDQEQGIILKNSAGELLLESAPQWFLHGKQGWILSWKIHAKQHFYGLGGKSGPLDRRGTRSHCWNVDAWGVHSLAAVKAGEADPLYANIPWLIIDTPQGAVGIFVHHPGKAFFAITDDVRLHPSQEPVNDYGGFFYFGAPQAPAEVFLIPGNSVQKVAQKFSQLIGPSALPPLWALGHHQCRWGYGDSSDLEYLHQNFLRHKIPTDGLWLDIDYMDSYKVFTLSKENTANLAPTLQKLSEQGRRCITILDPGVKKEGNYHIYHEGLTQKLFCHNPNGGLFHGFVWPGITMFPDFSLAETQTWWANHVQKLMQTGFAGFWLDMNDPATGMVDPEDMLFGHGGIPHWAEHNLYANKMAQATYKGVLSAQAKKRPFLLSRSGWTGINQWSALWLGDNFSTWEHLQQSLPMALNLSLSGVPMVGADVPGFGGNATPELMERWYQAHLLFPFLRNHNVKDSKPQEPWVFGEESTAIVRRALQKRYELLPYLYHCLVQHHHNGSLVLAPVAQDAKLLPTQFMVGTDIMVAPILEAQSTSREVYIPEGRWFAPDWQTWYQGPATISVNMPRDVLPLFVREGAVIPHSAQKVQHSSAEIDFNNLRYQAYISPEFNPEIAEFEHPKGSFAWDDGQSAPFRVQKQVDWHWETRHGKAILVGDLPQKSYFQINSEIVFPTVMEESN